ncbi:isopenicillin N synthase family dioxygenase [Caulobacter sp. KR2-114]|uniref:isopenicillin N synthase family dioxygenase n=1 Tax=Caulobacter sp. KR2-114 TaxID=3400912 RepID=UPI003BFF1090
MSCPRGVRMLRARPGADPQDRAEHPEPRPMTQLPSIDMAALFDPADGAGHARVAAQVGQACEAFGFFYLTGHGVLPETLAALERESRAFFALPAAEKAAIAMVRGGRAWRGWFPPGGELTSGRPDLKEGIYFGSELAADHPRVRAGLPMHGANLWPARPAGLRPAVETYMAQASAAAARLMAAVSLALGLEPGWFARAYTGEPTVLFRVFNYPARAPAGEAGQGLDWEDSWGVGEHTDYGLLTLLAQDRHGGLQVRTPGGAWLDAPPVAGTLVVNVGDMLERLTGGRFRSAPHRVANTSGHDRLSFPLFFDPDFLAPMRPLPQAAAEDARQAAARIAADRADRWDGASVHAFEGTYGDYLLGKVAKVFPQLQGELG